MPTPDRHLHVADDRDAELHTHLAHLAELCDQRDHAPTSQAGPLGKEIAEQRDVVLDLAEQLGLVRLGPVGIAVPGESCPPSSRHINGGLDNFGCPWDEDATSSGGAW